MTSHEYVLDTSAVMTVLNGEAETPQVVQLLEEGQRGEVSLVLPFVVLMEAEYLMLRRHSARDAGFYLELVSSWPAEIVESNETWRRRAAEVKAQGDISFADAWVAALGLARDATVVHKDPQFAAVHGLSHKDIRL